MKRRILALFLVFIIFSLSSCASIASRFEKVPSPEVTYAEFPFEIVYELGNETVTVSDVYVCEFDGFGWNESFGKHRRWKGYVRSTGDDYVLLAEDGNLKIVCDVGTPAYYMSDPDMAGADEFTPYVYYVRTYASGGVSSGTANIEQLLMQYKIELVSWSISEPIENSYL